LEDGGTVSIDWTGKPDKGVCIFIPGLGANSDFVYVKNCVRRLSSEGFEVAVLHARGVSDMYSTPQFFDLNNLDKFKTLINRVKETRPNHRLVGVGLSLGENILVNF
jgi:predicted alpha/beta-fold hydrolase